MVAKLMASNLPRLGNYEILGKIGKGGMGSVYKARQRGSVELVALKTISAAVADHPVLRKRFEQEFHTARLLDHPHIVRAFDFGEEGTVPYLVMEYVDGPSLGQRIESEGRLAEAEAVAIAVQIAHALHAAHQQGIIHRDVKPDNILLAAGGQAKLADLGLVKDLDGNLGLTQASAILGTPNFMAPEQFTDSAHVDFGSDIYSLGASLYLAVTGALPFLSKGHIGTLKKKLLDEILPPGQLVAGLSDRVNRAILRAIKADRKERPASCLEFITDLTGEAPEPITLPTSERSYGKQAAEATPRERRLFERYASRLESQCRPIRGAANSAWAVTFQDISARGIGLVVNRRFEPGTLLMVEVPVTSLQFIHILLARVISVHGKLPQGWIIGCELDRPLSEEDVQSLR